MPNASTISPQTGVDKRKMNLILVVEGYLKGCKVSMCGPEGSVWKGMQSQEGLGDVERGKMRVKVEYTGLEDY